MGTLFEAVSLTQSVIAILLRNLINPLCYSAFRRGQAISACLLRSPVSSDCAFGREGRSVSSRYTFPCGLGSALSVGFD